MFNYNYISPLRFWCHKVIPLVYDDSLSYYELVCKCVQKINELIANNAELPEYIKEEIAQQLSDTDTVRTVINQILAEDNIVLKSDLTSNDVDFNTCYTLYYQKSENFKTLQAFAHLDTGGYVAVFGKYDRIHYKIRVFTDEWEQVGSDSSQFNGHGNDCASNGTDRIYVLSSYKYNDVEYDNGLIRAIKYPELTEVADESFQVTYGGTPVKIESFCYDRINKKFYCMKGNEVYVYADNADRTFLEFFTLDDNMSTVYHDQYPRMAQQGSTFYNGMIGRIFSYPNLIAFYDVTTHKLVKMYSIPYKSEIGNALTELECGCFNGNDFYVSSFQRDNDQGLGTHTNCGAWNTILKINFWTNVPKTYGQKANEYENHKIYVDGSTTNNKHYGTLQYPYRTLSEAMSTLHSYIDVEQPIDIYCRVGTNVGVMRGESFPSTRINRYSLDGDTDTTYEVQGIHVMYSNFQMYYADVKLNDATSDGDELFPNTAYLRSCDAYFGYCTFAAPLSASYYPVRNVSGKTTLRQCTLTAYTGGYCIGNDTEGTVIEDNNTLTGAHIYNGAGVIINRTGKVDATANNIDGLLTNVNRAIIFDGSAKEVDEYSLTCDLSKLTYHRSAIVTMLHNTARTEFHGYASGDDAFLSCSAVSCTQAGVAQVHIVNLHIHFDTNKIEITKNRTVDLTSGTVYDLGDTVPSGIMFAEIKRIELS